jgi:hypothetical protein
MDFALPFFDFAFTCFDSGWPCQGDDLAIEGEWLQKATEVVGFVGFGGNVIFETQMFEREGGGDEDRQKWSACVRLRPRNFRKINNLVLPMSAMQKRGGSHITAFRAGFGSRVSWIVRKRRGALLPAALQKVFGRHESVSIRTVRPPFVAGEMLVRRGGTPRPTRFWRVPTAFYRLSVGARANGIRETNQKPDQLMLKMVKIGFVRFN